MEGTSKNKFFLVISGIISIIIGIAIYYISKNGLNKGSDLFVSNIFSWIIWLGILGGVVVLAILVFTYKVYYDIYNEIYKNLRKETKISRPLGLKELWLSGDLSHKQKYIGKIKGWSNRQSYDYDEKKEEFNTESVFLVRPNWYKKLIIVRCPTDKHTELHGKVYIKDIGLVSHREALYPSCVHLNWKYIDETMLFESMRLLQQIMISEGQPIINKALGLSKEDIKDLESKTPIQIYNEEKQK